MQEGKKVERCEEGRMGNKFGSSVLLRQILLYLPKKSLLIIDYVKVKSQIPLTTDMHNSLRSLRWGQVKSGHNIMDQHHNKIHIKL